LRGRGGAGFPTGIKWGFLPKNQDLPTYLVMNADESEPGTFKDRLLLEQDPHLCLEGLIIAAKALNVHLAIIYIRGEYAYGATVMQKAIKQAYLAGYLGEKIFKSKYALDVILHRGAGAYICGEETALLNSIEGKRGQPRLKPPFPTVSGLYGCPTIINNVETLANLPWIIEHGGSSYAKIGTAKSTGAKLISVSGNISRPGVYEVELGYPILDFIQNECRGIANGKKLKAVIPGGSSVAVLRADELNNVKLDYESLLAAGSMLGSGGMIVLDETIDMVEACANLQNFYAYESCGQCAPCREGGRWVEKLCRKLANGTGTRKDLDLVQSVCSGIAGKTICPFGDALVSPTLSFIKKFPEEFEKKIFRIKTYVR
jgi:NADH-quinone oxidoreductase subunit F